MRQEVTRDERDVVSVVRHGLSERIGRDRYVLWFHEGVRIDRRGSELVVAAGNEFLVDRLRKQFSADLVSVGELALGEVPTLALCG